MRAHVARTVGVLRHDEQPIGHRTIAAIVRRPPRPALQGGVERAHVEMEQVIRVFTSVSCLKHS
jgi:hypothetical protein